MKLFKCVEIISIVLFISILSACAGNSRLSTAEEKKEFLVSKMDEILQQDQSLMYPGISLKIRKNGEVIYSRSIGVANAANGALISENTVFEIASLAKGFTALSIMQLMEKGVLSLNDSIRQWIPELHETWNNITIRHLMSHQSGIFDYLNFLPKESLDGMTNQDLVSYFSSNYELQFFPGSSAAYSNGNYTLLAEIVSRSSEKSYGQYLHDNIFDPLNMNSSYVTGDDLPSGLPLALNNANDLKPDGIAYLTIGAIGIISSISDLNLFVIGLLSNEIVGENSLAAMSKIQARISDASYYGYGWYVGPEFSGILTHGGVLGGFRTIIYINQEEEIEYFALSNGGNETHETIHKLLSIIRSVYE